MTRPTLERTQAGATLPELLVTLALVGLVVLIPAMEFRRVSPPLERATENSLAFYQQVRSSALATTRAHRISTTDNRTLKVETAWTCASGSWTVDSELELSLPSSVYFASTGWQHCINSRGLADATGSYKLIDPSDHSGVNYREVELLLGGGTRIKP